MSEVYKKYKNILFAVVDFCIAILVYLFVSRFWTSSYIIPEKEFTIQIFTYSFVVVFFMFLFKVYKKEFGYTGYDGIFYIFSVSLFANVIYYLLSFIPIFQSYHIKYYMLLFFVCTFALIAYRIVLRFYRNVINALSKTSGKKTLIIGAGESAQIIYSYLKQTSSQNYRIIGFVDDSKKKIGAKMFNLPILGPINKLKLFVNDHQVKTVIIAIPSLSIEKRREILNICSKLDIEIKTLPSLSDIEEGAAINSIRTIDINDLLMRNSIRFDIESVSEYIKDKVVMVTGGGGSIGSELVRQVIKFSPKSVIIVDIYENNAYDIQMELKQKYKESIDLHIEIASVRDAEKMDIIFSQYKPDVVFHAAAHKHVPLMETNPEEAVKNNIFGTLNIANLALKYKCNKFILISTDKAVNPTNVMGATKRVCEMIVQYMGKTCQSTKFAAVRFGNVLGSNGSVIPLFKTQIENGGPVTVTHPDIIRYFMTIPEAANLVLQAGSLAKDGEVFILDMGEPVKIYDLAKKLISLYGYVPEKDIEIRFTGLRPGEKLYEELLLAEEGITETNEKKIFVGKLTDFDYDEFINNLSKLKDAADDNDKDKIIDILKSIVPNFNHE